MTQVSFPAGYSLRQKIGLFAGPLFFLAILVLPAPAGMPVEAKRTAAITVFMAVWWLTEAIHISATALLPIILFPLLGIENVREVTKAYGDSNIYLFFGGFLIAAALEKCKLHLRIAYAIITLIGKNPRQIILGFMIATALLSMWISNTATTLMMLPIGIAATMAIENLKDIDKKTSKMFGTALMLSIAYAANMGGLATLVGTPPNIVFAGAAETLFPQYEEIGFLTWMTFAFPVTFTMIPIIWLMLTRVIFKISGASIASARTTLLEKRRELGKMRYEEKAVFAVFLFTALAWIFRRDIDFGTLIIRGWAGLFENPEYINDATVAITGAMLMFIIPSDRKFSSFLLTWKEAKGIPWGVLILFGGGIALAGGFTSSGLSEWLGNNMQALKDLPLWCFILIIALMVTFLTELTSNIATTSVFMPIMGGLAVAVGYHPYLLMLPAVLSASCAFMLPVATPPNAIVFSSGRIRMMQMARTGFMINLVGAVVITLCIMFLARPLLGL
ncbi:SLC13 family permease [candidate division KSB1 bacterium]